MQEAAIMVDVPRVASDSFDQVVQQRERQVMRVAYRMLGNWADAEDAAQEVFVRLHRHGLGFASEGACVAWLYRVTVNLCVDRSRSKRTMCELPELHSNEPSAEAAVIRDEQKRRLMAALATLPPKERAAVVLREIEGLTSPEVAAILGSSDGTVRSQVASALKRLRGILTRGEA
jgi:RNA polymerase sigma-70 factor (ECF subfamily)